MKWKQLGVLETIENSQPSFSIQLLTADHPSADRKAVTDIKKIELSRDEKTIESWLGSEPQGAFKNVEVIYRDPSDFHGETGIVSVTIVTPKGEVVID